MEGKETGKEGKGEGKGGGEKVRTNLYPPHLRKRSDAPVLPQYGSRVIRFHTLKYVRMIPKI